MIEIPSLAITQRGQREIISGLFSRYGEAIEQGRLELFPAAYREELETRAQTEPAKIRVVADLIAGLTEPAAEDIYRRMAGMRSGSVSSAAGRIG